MSLSATILDVLGNTIDNVAIMNSNAAIVSTIGAIRLGDGEKIGWRNSANTADHQIGIEGTDDIVIEVKGNNLINLRINNILQWSISAGNTDFFGNDLDTIGSLSDNSANPGGGAFVGVGNNVAGINWRNAGNTDDIGITVNASDDFVFAIDGTTELTLSATELNLQNNKLANVNPTTITDFTTVTAATGDFVWIIDATDGLSKKANASDFLGGGSQTPWLQNIDGGGFDLLNAGDIIEQQNATGTLQHQLQQ